VVECLAIDIGGPEQVKASLESEALTFDLAGRAGSDRRWLPDGELR
jgi:hypothetical protein